MNRLLIATVCGLMWCVSAHGQDPYFTQFYTAPLELNPALTGAIEGTFRVSTIYRDQWSGLGDSPYRTYALSGDVRFGIGQRQQDYVGGGIAFVADRVPVFDFNTTGIKLSGAFHKRLSDGSQQFLSGGVNFGLMQRNVNVEQLYFNDQFNGANGYTLGTSELLPENNFAFLDLGIGLNYAVKASDNLQLTIGGALAHITQPSSSFGSRTDGVDVPDVKLYSRWTAYVSSSITLSDEVRLLPRFAVSGQGPYMFMNFGSNVRFSINRYNSNALQIGAGLRLARDIESITPSAVYMFAGLELGSFLLGISYDYNLEDLANERLGQGVIEVSITYIGEYVNNDMFCPTF